MKESPNIKHDDLLEEIHKLRLKVLEDKERSKDRHQIKIQLNKKEKDDILTKYFMAKKQLNSI
jgi:hypothetical protein